MTIHDEGRAQAMPDSSTRLPSHPTNVQAMQQKWSRRRWAGVLVISVSVLLGLCMDEISARTALMLGGMLLAFALSADRLDHPET
ncbi:hypothetical protein QM467_04980 [Rhodoblastus sp. 17X3]|uniref:hypothetical protein n=1 Tax=Rhodoblastus sp. 17X3 TaxID=3047026 RepID=UPI0024B80A37|nr:hypothetical protein [Rhodoblastus sp. 17X3]MDI9847415.1 hypothetical protein [Rhodoblastus sp. 17X3]